MYIVNFVLQNYILLFPPFIFIWSLLSRFVYFTNVVYEHEKYSSVVFLLFIRAMDNFANFTDTVLIRHKPTFYLKIIR
jgi:hypothetical protein